MMIILCPFYTKVDDTKHNLTIVFPTFMIYTAIKLKFNHTVSADEKYLPTVERAFYILSRNKTKHTLQTIYDVMVCVHIYIYIYIYL